jgi:hypothetical protein
MSVEENQVSPFHIPTSDGERLYAWLVVPLKVYAVHETEFATETSGPLGDVKRKLGFKLLESDPESRLVIYCKKAPSLPEIHFSRFAHHLLVHGVSDIRASQFPGPANEKECWNCRPNTTN